MFPHPLGSEREAFLCWWCFPLRKRAGASQHPCPHHSHLHAWDPRGVENHDGSTSSGQMDWQMTRAWAPRFSFSQGTRKSKEDARRYSRKWVKGFYDWCPSNSATHPKITANVDITFRVLCGFLILDDFLMSTSVVFTHPGWKWKNRETKESLRVRFLIHAWMTCRPGPWQLLVHGQSRPLSRASKNIYYTLTCTRRTSENILE